MLTIIEIAAREEDVYKRQPFYATPGSAAMDLCACVDEPVEIAPRALVSIPTGIAIALPSPEYVALVFARSGLGIKLSLIHI